MTHRSSSHDRCLIISLFKILLANLKDTQDIKNNNTAGKMLTLSCSFVSAVVLQWIV